MELLRRSSELSLEVERLQAEEAVLSRHTEQTSVPLKYHDTLDYVGSLLGVSFKCKGQIVAQGIPKI